MIERIPLDSSLWVPRTTDMEDPRPFLNGIVGREPSVDQMYDVLDVLYETDDPSPQFYYAIPYVLDILEKHPVKMLGPLLAFCQQVHDLDHRPEEDLERQHLNSAKPRILKVICAALPNAKAGDKGYENVAILLSGIANLMGHTDLGRQLTELEPPY